jgi:uncharacterized protein
MTQQNEWFRPALLCTLVKQAPTRLGRTAIMKLAYVLQIVKGVPLGYDFRLYTYGPFDSDVLYDLGAAGSLGAVKSELVNFPSGSGYGYEFSLGANADFVLQKASGTLRSYEPAIRWALEEFGTKSAAELELLSTIIYADREAVQRMKQLPIKELAKIVGDVKPRFPQPFIFQKIAELSQKGLLLALALTE